MNLVKDYQYVLIKTGYTYRITPRGKYRNVFFNRLYKHMPFKYKKNVKLIFVFDALTRTRLYKIGKDNAEVLKMIELVKELGLFTSGIACFRCDDKNYKHLKNAIEENTYCKTNQLIFDALCNSNDKSVCPSIRCIQWIADS